jgi:hypothetical protein
MPAHQRLLPAAASLRARAKEVSAKADTFQNAGLQQKMREVAARYERLATQAQAEDKSGDTDKA